jgi:hypothetical protein
MAIVTTASVVTYLAVIQFMFPTSLRALRNLAGHLLPARRAKPVPTHLATADTQAVS